MIGALALCAGGAEAKILGLGKGGAEAGKDGDERVCTTVTTVVRRGSTVLSTTSSTRCDEDKGQAAAATRAPEPAVAQAASPPRADPIVPPSGSLESSRSLASSLFGLGTPGLKPRDVLGEWSALEPGAAFACRVRLTRETFSGGYRVFTSGCRGPIGAASAWRFEETVAGLYGPDGGPIAKLAGDKKRLAGKTPDGQLVELTR
jgi:hypothetical protein